MATKISTAKIIAFGVLGFLVYSALLFVPAGTLNWPEAWLILLVLFLYAGVATLWLRKHDPKLLKERISLKKPVKGWDKIFMVGSAIFMIGEFPLAALDAVRYQWSQVPLALQVVGFIGIVLPLVLTFFVIRENTYLSRIVEVQKKRHHKVITTGPYRYVRHPMYFAFIILFFCAPLALGSLYALIPAFIVAAFLIARTYLEDKTLHKELRGYKAYAKKTRYRLLPGVW